MLLGFGNLSEPAIEQGVPAACGRVRRGALIYGGVVLGCFVITGTPGRSAPSA